MYKSLFIDLDDTLWAFSENAQDTFQEVYNKYLFNSYFDSFDQFYTIYKLKNTELWVDYGKGKITKEELNKLRFLHPLLEVGVNNEVLAKAYSEDFLRIIPTKGKLMPYAKEALDYLSSKYRLFILSNGFRELQHQKMHSAGIYHYFEKVVLSDDILVHKPYPEIFYFALSATQSELRNSLMIGDSWEADIVGAKGVGMDQMYYCEKKDVFASFAPTFQIESWKNIQNIL